MPYNLWHLLHAAYLTIFVRIPNIFFAIYNEVGKDKNLFLSIIKRRNLKNLNKESIEILEILYCC
jgi:hypothetical protein